MEPPAENPRTEPTTTRRTQEQTHQLAHLIITFQDQLTFAAFGRICDHYTNTRYDHAIHTLVAQLHLHHIPIHQHERELLTQCWRHLSLTGAIEDPHDNPINNLTTCENPTWCLQHAHEHRHTQPTQTDPT